MRSRKDYEKELRVQKALGTLSRYMVSRPFGKIGAHCELFHMPEQGLWFISCEISDAVNAEHAIDMIMEQEDFPEDAREYLSARRM